TPNSGRLEAAMATLEFMVSVDPYLNETSRHADVILPPTDPARTGHYDFAFTTISIRNVAVYNPPVFPPDRDGMDDCEILARLTGGAPGDYRSAEDILDERLRAGAYGLTLDDLRAAPHGIDLGPLEPSIPEVLRTPNGRIDLAPEPLVADVDRLRVAMERGADDGSLVLVGRRHVRSNNSWLHNVEVLVKGKERCTLQVHPLDADRLGLVAGGAAKVTSRVGSLVAPVEITDIVMPGVVSLPHGWGYGAPGTKLDVAARYAGVNSNVLTDEAVIDPLSGNAVLNGIPVEVTPA
ncbi:MAG: molybdopterin dinucleotide binding domain-containing protein, partial [Actinomycetota bacterium]